MPLQPGPAATVADLRAAQERHELVRTELPRIRAAGVMWRNGLGALLAALVSFGLLKGRSDVSQLQPTWAAAVGIVLLTAILAGAIGALSLLRAAHGSPAVTMTRRLPPRVIAEHLEALASAAALQRGIRMTLLCTALLVAAVAATWYGPVREQPVLEVGTPTGPLCGKVVRLDAGTLTIETSAGEVTVNLDRATTMRPLERCPAG